jgi:hypothetical protein
VQGRRRNEQRDTNQRTKRCPPFTAATRVARQSNRPLSQVV